MIREAEFLVDVSLDDCARFAQLSGDWNPLHTNAEHARLSTYGGQVLHGAFSAGLISRLAGMYIPGRDCLLHGMKLRFVSPVLPPARLRVYGKLTHEMGRTGRVTAEVSNTDSGVIHVDATYDFGYHEVTTSVPGEPVFGNETSSERIDSPPAAVLVTGASGGLGGELLRRLGNHGIPIKRNSQTGRIEALEFREGTESKFGRNIKAIVHCAWPTPDNRRFIDLVQVGGALEQHIAGPLRDIQGLAALIAERGLPGAPLILVGSSFAKAGRHYYRMPLYSISKSMIPTIVEVIALELASAGMRCFGVVFDVLDGGMNKGIGASSRQAHADRSPWGELPTVAEAAEQILWLLENRSRLISGGMVTLTSGSVP